MKNFEVGHWYLAYHCIDGWFKTKTHVLVIDRSVDEISIIEENDDDFIDMKKVKKYRVKQGETDCEIVGENEFATHAVSYGVDNLSDYAFKY